MSDSEIDPSPGEARTDEVGAGEAASEGSSDTGEKEGGAPGRRLRLRPVLLGLSVAVGLLLVVLPFVLLLACRFVPPPATAFMIQKRMAAFAAGEPYRLDYRWTGWGRISPHARIAVVAAEDQNFPRHDGFDVHAIEKAWEERERGGRVRGASTISQQVAKNLFLTPDRSFLRKGLEAWFTVLIEFVWPKRRILEVYLNVAEFGPGIFGVGAASARFFGKQPAQLSRYEAALLAAVLPNPRRLHADRPSAYVRERAEWILGQMRQLGEEEYLRRL